VQAADFLADEAAVSELVQCLGDVFHSAVTQSSRTQQAACRTDTGAENKEMKEIYPSGSMVCTHELCKCENDGCTVFLLSRRDTNERRVSCAISSMLSTIKSISLQ
jgi:hypothetical protein